MAQMSNLVLSGLISKVLKRASEIDSSEAKLIFAIIERAVYDYFGVGSPIPSGREIQDAKDFLETERVAPLAQLIGLESGYIRLVLTEAKFYSN